MMCPKKQKKKKKIFTPEEPEKDSLELAVFAKKPQSLSSSQYLYQQKDIGALEEWAVQLMTHT